MPLRSYGKMDDVELGAIWAWLRSLPPLPDETP
jgi:hypothetical protein